MAGLLRVLMAILAGLFLARLLRGLRSPPRAPRRPGPRSGLDPGRAVRASWSEVDDGEEGRREDR